MKELDPDLKEFLIQYYKDLEGEADVSIEAARQGYDDGYLAGSPRSTAPVEKQDFALSTGATMRLYTPPERSNDALILYFHGGGFALGSVDAYDNQSCWIAEKTGQRVVTVDYRLAPEHPFPAAPDDARAAWDAVQDLGLARHDQIILAGDSAGGALSLVTALDACAAKAPPMKIVALYPATDMSSPRDLAEAKGSLLQFASGYYLNTEEMIWFREQYVPTLEQAKDWRASVVFASGLEHLPPTTLISARRDPLFDQAASFHKQVKALGVSCTHLIFEDVLHNFMEHYQISSASRSAAEEVAKALKA